MFKNFLIALKNLQHAIKTASKRTIQITAEATGDLIGNKIADKITSVMKISTKELPNDETEEDVEITTYKKRYISPKLVYGKHMHSSIQIFSAHF